MDRGARRRNRAACALGIALACLASIPAAGAATERVVLKRVVFELERAADPSSRTVGLMFRDSIDDRGGMIFVFPNDAPRTFWMRNCLVDMDLLFLDARGRVVAVHQMQAEPLRLPQEGEATYLGRLRRYPSGAPTRFAIELKSGMAKALRLRVGDRVDLQRVAPAVH
jgi:hypothetical protein